MKVNYADALHNLEEISDEIHEKRRSEKSTFLDHSKSQVVDPHLFSRDSVNTYQNSKSNNISSEVSHVHIFPQIKTKTILFISLKNIYVILLFIIFCLWYYIGCGLLVYAFC